MTYTAIYPLRANGKVYGAGESIPSSLKGVNFDSLVSKGFISKNLETVSKQPEKEVESPSISSTPVKSTSAKRKPTTEEQQ